MIGLLIKDLLVLRKTMRLYLAMLVFYLVLTVSGAFDYSMLTGFVSLFTMMLPISSFAYDELARWEKYAAALPVGRRGIVGSKYLFAIAMGGIAEALMAVMAVILMVIQQVQPAEILITGLACVGIGLLMNSILLPLLFKLGAEKGRTLTMGVFGLLFLIGFFAAKLAKGSAFHPSIPNAVIAALFAVLVVLALLTSYYISIKIFEHKDL